MQKSVSIYILAGGKSTRMGEEKALLLLGNQSVIQYLIDEALQITRQVFLVTADEKYSSFGVACISDLIPNCGPAGGIDAALHHTRSELNVILSCDNPFVKAKAIQVMIDSVGGSEICFATNHGFVEMMFSVFRQSCKSTWRELLLTKEYKLSNLAKGFKCKLMSGEKLEAAFPNLFFNMNTRLDYEYVASFFPQKEDLNESEFLTLLKHPDVQLVDVRNDDERPHICHSNLKRISMNCLEREIEKLTLSKPIVFVCHAGIRSKEAVQIVAEDFHGVHVFHLKGGLIANEKARDLLVAK